MISTMSGADFQQWEPVLPEWDAAREAFEELIDDLYFPADAVVGDISLDGVVNNSSEMSQIRLYYVTSYLAFL